ncbi:MAG: hypothetical protein ACTHM6_06115 [Tepidisphaeraceae bacterium]
MAPTILERPRKRGFSFPFLAIIGALLCGGAVMAVRGNGISPALYFLFAVLALPLLARTIGRRSRRSKIAELLSLLAGAVCCSGVAYFTAHPSPRAVFQHVFDQPPSTGVSDLWGQKQWYDGRVWLVSFRLNDAEFARLMAETNLKPDEMAAELTQAQENTRAWAAIHMWSQLAYGVWPIDPPARRSANFTRDDDPAGTSGDVRLVNVYRDLDTGRVWAVRID